LTLYVLNGVVALFEPVGSSKIPELKFKNERAKNKLSEINVLLIEIALFPITLK
jgi:hypothetical protein